MSIYNGCHPGLLVPCPENIVPEIPENDQQLWDKFHLRYVNLINENLGIKRPNLPHLSKLERRIFKRFSEEYHKNKDIKRGSESYAGFFHSLFISPYGFMCERNFNNKGNKDFWDFEDESENKLFDINTYEGIDANNEEIYNYLKAKNPELKKEPKKDLTEEREFIKIIEFNRKINIPVLLYHCITHPKKELKVPQKNINLNMTTRKFRDENGNYIIHKINTDVKPYFPTTVWEYLISDTSECISIEKTDYSLSKGPGGPKYKPCVYPPFAGKEISKLPKDADKTIMTQLEFNKYWLASALHHAHPNIFYLTFKTPSAFIPTPFKVKLMQTTDTKDKQKYLVVGGLMGLSFKYFENGEKIIEGINESIKEFTALNFEDHRILYNFNHPPETISTEFLDYIKKKHSINQEYLPNLVEIKKTKFTHFLKTPQELEIENISTYDEKGNKKYNGEQYSETFYINENKNQVGAFTNLEGRVLGFDIDSSKQLRRKGKIKKIIGGAGIGLILAGGLFGAFYSTPKNIGDIAAEQITNEICPECTKDEKEKVKSRVLLLTKAPISEEEISRDMIDGAVKINYRCDKREDIDCGEVEYEDNIFQFVDDKKIFNESFNQFCLEGGTMPDKKLSCKNVVCKNTASNGVCTKYVVADVLEYLDIEDATSIVMKKRVYNLNSFKENAR